MAGAQLGAVFRQIQNLFAEGSSTGFSDTQLLKRFATRHDEAAFAAIMARHGPMVQGVCRRILRDSSDAEDAFQATFLILARKAGSAWVEGQLGGWLHKVACRIAIRASAAPRVVGTTNGGSRNWHPHNIVTTDSTTSGCRRFMANLLASPRDSGCRSFCVISRGCPTPRPPCSCNAARRP